MSTGKFTVRVKSVKQPGKARVKTATVITVEDVAEARLRHDQQEEAATVTAAPIAPTTRRKKRG